MGPLHHWVPQWTLKKWKKPGKTKLWVATRIGKGWRIGRKGVRQTLARRDQNTVFFNLEGSEVSYAVEEQLAIIENDMKGLCERLEGRTAEIRNNRRGGVTWGIEIGEEWVELVKTYIMLQMKRGERFRRTVIEKIRGSTEVQKAWEETLADEGIEVEESDEELWKDRVLHNADTANLLRRLDDCSDEEKQVLRRKGVIYAEIPKEVEVTLLLGSSGIIEAQGDLRERGQRWMPVSPKAALGLVDKEIVKTQSRAGIGLTELPTKLIVEWNLGTAQQNDEIVGVSRQTLEDVLLDMREDDYREHPEQRATRERKQGLRGRKDP